MNTADCGPKPYITKDGSLITELVHPSTRPGVGVSLAEAVVEAGVKTERHFHVSFDEIYYCLEGAGVLFVNDASFPFSPGSWRFIPKGAAHCLAATTKMKILCVCCPGYTHEDTLFASL